MFEVTGTFTSTNDGSIELPIEGKPVKFVKESDLLAVKGGAEAKSNEWVAKETKFNTDLAEANRLREETRQSLLQAQTEKEQLVTRFSDYDATKIKVGELETALGSHKESVSKYETELAGRIRHNLINTYGAKEEAVKDKDLNQLRNLEEAAKIFGNGHIQAKPANYDGGKGGPSGGVPESSLERAKRIIEEHEAKMGRPAQVSNTAIK